MYPNVLTYINLSGCDLTAFDPSLGIPTVKEMNLSHNHIADGSTLLENFKALERLDLSFNRIQTLSRDNIEVKATQLTYLNLAGNWMQTGRDLAALFVVKSIQHLSVRFNPWRSELDYTTQLAANLPKLVTLDGQSLPPMVL